MAEYQLDNNAYGWFRPAWRNGEWAVALANAAAMRFSDYHSSLYDEIRETLDAERSGATYARAGELHSSLIQPKINTDTALLLAAALRCLQVLIANSHGGGTVYNEILIPAFLPLDPAIVAGDVLYWRCHDAIGTSPHLKGDRCDRTRSAFSIAWRRGLYLAAYSLPSCF